MSENQTKLPDTVYVDKALQHLMDDFVLGRKKNVADMKIALSAQDWPELGRIAHILIGVCGSYGFDDFGSLCEKIEFFVATKNAEKISALLSVMETNINTVQIIYE
jgi:hypothetical protein